MADNINAFVIHLILIYQICQNSLQSTFSIVYSGRYKNFQKTFPFLNGETKKGTKNFERVFSFSETLHRLVISIQQPSKPPPWIC